MTDTDLHAVRTLLAPRVTGEPPTWESIVAQLRAPARPAAPLVRRRRWMLAPVAAAAAVIAVVGAFVAVRHYAGPAPAASSPAADPSPTASPAGLNMATVLAAARAPYPDSAVADPATVLSGLIQVAGHTAAGVIGPGQYLCIRSVGRAVASRPDGTDDPQDRESWHDPQGMITVQLFGDGDLWMSEPDPAIAAQRQEFAAKGPTIVQPTPTYLAQLPTDPAALRAILLEGLGDSTKVSGDGFVFLMLAQVLSQADLAVPPAVRVAMLRVLAAMPGLTAAELSAEGQTLVAIRIANPSNVEEMIFDPATAHLVGQGSGTSSMDPAAPHRYQGFWIQRVVNTLSDHA